MPPLQVDVAAALNERSSQNVADRLVRDMSQAGQRAGDAFQSNMQRSMAATDQLGRNLVGQFGNHGRASGASFGTSFSSQLAQSLPGVSGFASAMSGYEGAAGKVGALAGRALGLAFTTAAAGLIGAAGYTLFKGFERYQAIDAATNRLENLNRTMQATGRQAIDVGAVMDVVNQSVQDTPFALDQAFSVATRALASNTGDLQRFMGVVTDAAGFAGSGVDEIGEAFLKVANKGKVSMEEIGNELRNIPILPWLQEQMGVTGGALAKMISDGQVGLEDLMKAVETNAAGFAKASGDTVAGAMANAQTAVARLGANFLGALFGKPMEQGNDLVAVLKAVRERIDEISAWVSAHQDDIKKTFEDGVGAARDLVSGIGSVLDTLDRVGIGVGDVVKAFVAWKAISGVASLATALGGINTTLATTLPASAATGAAGISAALSRIAVPLWLTTLIEDKAPNFPIQDQPTGEDRIFPGWVPLLPFWEDQFRNFGGGSTGDGGLPVGPSGPPRDPLGEAFGLTPGGLGGLPGAQRERRGGPAGPGGPAPAGGDIMPAPGMGDGSDGPRLPPPPAVPYAEVPAIDPRLQMTAGLYSAATSVADADTRLAEKQARLNQLRQTNAATADEILALETDVAKAQRDADESRMRFTEAQQNAFEKQNKALDKLSGDLGEIGAKIDDDFGVSKGLAGIAENVTKFLLNLALVPLMAQVKAGQAAAGYDPANAGKGLMGVLGAQGVFGSQYTQAAQQAAMASKSGAGTYGASSMGPLALQPGMATGGVGYGGYTSDSALLAGVPAGRYSQTQAADLTQGIGDCSSAVEDLVNIMDGRPTGGRSMATGNAAQWLTERGFLPGSMPGAFNVGFNSGHMQATLPGGTPFNWGSDAAAAAGGRTGTGAFDPSFTSNYYRPVGGGSPSATTPSATGPSPGGAPAAPGANGPAWFPPAAGLPANGPGGGYGVTGGPGSAGGPGFGNMPLSPGAGAPGMPGAPGVGRGAGGAFPGMPGIGSAAAPSQSVAGGRQFGQGIPASGGIGYGGGLIGAAAGAAGMGMNLMAPGSGAGAQIGMDLAMRAIGAGGQHIGNAVGGVMETFMLNDSALGDPGKSWIGRLAIGAAGMRPALPNSAGALGGEQNKAMAEGGKPQPPGPLSPQQAAEAQAAGKPGGTGEQAPGDTTNITVNNQRAREDGTGRDVQAALGAQQAAKVSVP